MDHGKRAIVIYHDNCNDGFASAWAFHYLKEKDYEEVTYVPMRYGPVPDSVNLLNSFAGKDIYILDFCWPRDTLTLVCEYAKKVLVLDHHKTAQADLENWPDQPVNLEIVFDMNRSGAGITWDYFRANSTSPLVDITSDSPLVRYVQDRDLWQFKLPYSKEINARIALAQKTFRSYSDLDMELTCDDRLIIETGKALREQFLKLCTEIADDARECVIVDSTTGEEYVGLSCNCTGQFSSEVGEILHVRSGTYGATYYSDKTGGVKWSLRSTGDYDVSKIAKQCGGGGHRNAAGFYLYPNETDRSNCIRVWTIKESPNG